MKRIVAIGVSSSYEVAVIVVKRIVIVCATCYSATVGNVEVKNERKILNINIFKLLKRMCRVGFSTVAL